MNNAPQTNRSASLRAARALTLAVSAAVAAATLGGCAALVVGGAVGTAMVVTDRRTAGVQIEDQSIELKSLTRIREAIADRGHVNVTSYNRMVLITGEVPTEADRVAVEQAIARIENVRSTVNDLAVMGSSSLAARSNDTHPDEQGQGDLRRCEGPAVQRGEGGHRARHRLPDGPRHRTRGVARGGAGARHFRRAEGRAGIRDPDRGRAGDAGRPEGRPKLQRRRPSAR